MPQITSTEEVPIIILNRDVRVEAAIEYAADLIAEPDAIDNEYARGQIELIMALGGWSVHIYRGLATMNIYLRPAEPEEARAAIRESILNFINLTSEKGA